MGDTVYAGPAGAVGTPAIYPDLAGKVAVITGSSRGIGAATCRTLAASGAKVVVNGRDEAALHATVETIRSGRRRRDRRRGRYRGSGLARTAARRDGACLRANGRARGLRRRR